MVNKVCVAYVISIMRHVSMSTELLEHFTIRTVTEQTHSFLLCHTDLTQDGSSTHSVSGVRLWIHIADPTRWLAGAPGSSELMQEVCCCACSRRASLTPLCCCVTYKAPIPIDRSIDIYNLV